MILKVSAVKTLRITAVIAILTFLTTPAHFSSATAIRISRTGLGWRHPDLSDSQTMTSSEAEADLLLTIKHWEADSRQSPLLSMSPALCPGRVDNSPYCLKIKRTDTSLLRFIICNKGNDLHLHQIMKHASLILAVMRRIIRRAVSIIIFSLLFSASYLSYNMTRNI